MFHLKDFHPGVLVSTLKRGDNDPSIPAEVLEKYGMTKQPIYETVVIQTDEHGMPNPFVDVLEVKAWDTQEEAELGHANVAKQYSSVN